MSKNDDGVEGGSKRIVPPNVFVVSAGGKGHIPFPLFAKERAPAEPQPPDHKLVFMGSTGTNKVRQDLVDAMTKSLGADFYAGKSPQWEDIHAKSWAILCPRGYGRNSFRLTETLQMGYIPVYVYDDICWLPYYNSVDWDSFACVASSNEFSKITEFVGNLTPERVESMRSRIRGMYATHFSVNGAMTQLENFLMYGFTGTDLRCSTRSFVH